jgi:hypothetical protein
VHACCIFSVIPSRERDRNWRVVLRPEGEDVEQHTSHSFENTDTLRIIMSAPGTAAKPQFLGETPVDVATHPKFKSWTPSEWAMVFIDKFGQIEGCHHRGWVLDQVARILKGTKVSVKEAKWSDGQHEYRYEVDEPASAYLSWRREFVDEGTDPETDETWTQDHYDEGTAP